MNLQDELFDLIENYLNGDMSEAERLAFEERIAQDQLLADKVSAVRATNDAIYYASLAEFKSTIGKDLKNITYKPPINWKKTGAFTFLSLAVVSGLATYFITQNSSEVSDKKTDSDKNIVIRESAVVKETSSSSEKDKSGISNSITGSDSPKNTDTVSYKKTSNIPVADSLVKNSAAAENKNAVPVNNTSLKQTDSNLNKTETSGSDVSKNPCDKTFKITAEASCKEKENGVISILSDGSYSYVFQTGIKSISGTKATFMGLSAGQHEILVTYGNECTYTKKVSVGEKWCAMNEAYSFNPDYNEKWKPVYESGSSGTIIIYDKLGKEIYSMPFGSGNEEWIGNDKQGMPVSVGVYVAFIIYSDGRKEKIELTVIR